jgi:hypothetical protein
MSLWPAMINMTIPQHAKHRDNTIIEAETRHKISQKVDKHQTWKEQIS